MSITILTPIVDVVRKKRKKEVIAIQKRQEASKRHFDQRVALKCFVKDQHVLLWNKSKDK